MPNLTRPRSSWCVVHCLGILLPVVSLVVSANAGDESPRSEIGVAVERYFEQKVRPLLAENCFSCHGSRKQKGGLRLDSLESVLKGGEAGPAVVAGKPDESLLIEAIHYQGLEMPPTGKLAPEQIGVLTRWVSLGAPWPSRNNRAHAASNADQSGKSPFNAVDRGLWSLKPVRRPVVPDFATPGFRDRTDWSQNPIDRFVRKSLLDHGLTPAPEAGKAILIRRVTFDLTGLPPTPDEVDAFLVDNKPDAYERLIDRLLASPYYGQRWGRHWLDLVRYAESDGYRQDAFRPAAWRYRDYVVGAFNTDKPYDRFLTEQLAGDELDPDDPELRIAAGYLRLGTYEYNQRNVRGQWSDILNDITDTTGEVFLGLGIGCALSRSQVRPDPSEGLLPAPSFLHPPALPRRPDDRSIARMGRLSIAARGRGESGGRGASRAGCHRRAVPRARNCDGNGQVSRGDPGSPP